MRDDGFGAGKRVACVWSRSPDGQAEQVLHALDDVPVTVR
jgi:hypothetical protein